MKINISQRSGFPTKKRKRSDSFTQWLSSRFYKKQILQLLWKLFAFLFGVYVAFLTKYRWNENGKKALSTVFCRTLSLIFSTKSLFGIGLENISILMLSVCKHEQYALMVTKSFGTTSMLYAHILRIHILTLLDDKGISVSCQFLNHCSSEPERSEVSACCCYCKTCSQNMGCALLLFPKLWESIWPIGTCNEPKGVVSLPAETRWKGEAMKFLPKCERLFVAGINAVNFGPYVFYLSLDNVSSWNNDSEVNYVSIFFFNDLQAKDRRFPIASIP